MAEIIARHFPALAGLLPDSPDAEERAESRRQALKGDHAGQRARAADHWAMVLVDALAAFAAEEGDAEAACDSLTAATRLDGLDGLAATLSLLAEAVEQEAWRPDIKATRRVLSHLRGRELSALALSAPLFADADADGPASRHAPAAVSLADLLALIMLGPQGQQRLGALPGVAPQEGARAHARAQRLEAALHALAQAINGDRPAWLRAEPAQLLVEVRQRLAWALASVPNGGGPDLEPAREPATEAVPPDAAPPDAGPTEAASAEVASPQT